MIANELFGLAAVTLALGITCWLLPGPENHSPFMKETKSKAGER